MNKLTKINDNLYLLETEDGQSFECKTWFEKKTNQWHVKLPNDNGSGRTYVRVSHFDNTNIYEFETKTSHREGLSYGSWKDRMTDEEKSIYEECLSTIKKIEEDCKMRKPKELTEEEKLLLQIQKLQSKLNNLKK